VGDKVQGSKTKGPPAQGGFFMRQAKRRIRRSQGYGACAPTEPGDRSSRPIAEHPEDLHLVGSSEFLA
jgi:hypothetical protein